MAENGDQKKGDEKQDGPKRLTRKEYDKLVQGVDDIFFGGVDQSDAEKKPSLGEPASETPKSGDGDK